MQSSRYRVFTVQIHGGMLKTQCAYPSGQACTGHLDVSTSGISSWKGAISCPRKVGLLGVCVASPRRTPCQSSLLAPCHPTRSREKRCERRGVTAPLHQTLACGLQQPSKPPATTSTPPFEPWLWAAKMAIEPVPTSSPRPLLCSRLPSPEPFLRLTDLICSCTIFTSLQIIVQGLHYGTELAGHLSPEISSPRNPSQVTPSISKVRVVKDGEASGTAQPKFVSSFAPTAVLLCISQLPSPSSHARLQN